MADEHGSERRPRRGTRTSAFGVGKREAHDASGFYDRFQAPELSDEVATGPPPDLAEPLVCGDARHMDAVPDGSVALVVTSPPYFAGKEYEAALGEGGIPGSYLEYLGLLRDVFAQCRDKLEPGGRIAVNVANLGRKPYRSLAADIVGILQDDLRLLLRGEVVWIKGRGASGSCAWGSFRSAVNPVLRDTSERVIIASKGRFDRAPTVKRRDADGLPCRSTIGADEFMESTLDVWEIPPESARRVGHPAPFPVALPERLIGLYTFEGDLVLDPFLGAGSTAVAAARLGRRWAGYDTDPGYVDLARRRVRDELAGDADEDRRLDRYAHRVAPDGAKITDEAARVLESCGFTIERRAVKLARLGLSLAFVARDATGAPWCFDLTGGLTTTRGGLARTSEAFEALGRAHLLAGDREDWTRLVLLTSALPPRRSAADVALRAAGPEAFFDAVELLSAEGQARLRRYGAGHDRPLVGFWTQRDLASGLSG